MGRMERNALMERDALAARLVEAFAAWEWAERNFFPGIVPQLRERFAPITESLAQARNDFESRPEPAEKDADRILLDASGLCIDALALAAEADWLEQALVNVRKAGRRIHRVQEMLFALCSSVDAIHRYFLEPQAFAVPPEHPAGRTPSRPAGLLQAGLEKDPYARGSCSFYIPPGRDGSEPLPLVVALHGGFGHGRDFIWTWLREARSRRFALACPSSCGITWSITGPDADEALLRQVLTYAASHWAIDSRRILLTGISDGATYALKRALDAQTPFSHFAVVSGILAPFDLAHAKDRSIFWVHGAKDWMFPVWRARMGEKELAAAGAEVTLEIVPDLHHAYPRERNDRILTWFDPGLSLPEASG